MSETAPDKSKTPESTTSKAAKHKKRKTRHGGGFVKLLILLLIVALAGFGVWRYGLKSWLDYRARVTGLEAVVQALQEAQKREREDTGGRVDELSQRQRHLEEGVSKLLDQNGHMRKDWLLAEAEYLIKLAGHRLLLERDIRTAIVALEAASTRLGEIGDPGVIQVRKQISKDIRALKKIPLQDISGISLTLSTLVQDIVKLPLRIPAPKDIKERAKEQRAAPRDAANFKELVGMVWDDLLSLFNYRVHDQPIQPLLQPEQRFFLVQNLQLKLEQARLALLQNEIPVYQERLQEAQKWVKQYFDQEHSSTRAMLDTLKSLLQQEVQAELPELTRSYSALKRYRESGAVTSKSSKKKPAKKKLTEQKPTEKKIPDQKPAEQKPTEKKPEQQPESNDKDKKTKPQTPAEQVTL